MRRRLSVLCGVVTSPHGAEPSGTTATSSPVGGAPRTSSVRRVSGRPVAAEGRVSATATRPSHRTAVGTTTGPIASVAVATVRAGRGTAVFVQRLSGVAVARLTVIIGPHLHETTGALANGLLLFRTLQSGTPLRIRELLGHRLPFLLPLLLLLDG